METIGTFPIELSGEPYQIEIGSWKARDITDFSPKTTVPGTGAVFGTLQMYQPIMASNWQHGFGFVWHDDEAGYLRTDGGIDTRHRGAAMLFTEAVSSDTNNNQKDGGITYGSSFFTWGASGIRDFTSSTWANQPVQRPIFDAASEGSGTGIADLGTLTISHTITTEGSSRMLLVMVAVDDPATDFSDESGMESNITATYPVGGSAQAMTVVTGSASINTIGIVALYILNPDTGANNIVVSFNTAGGTTDAVVIGASFIYCLQTSSVIRSVEENEGTAVLCTDVAHTDSAAIDLVVDMVSTLQTESEGNEVVGALQTVIAADDDGTDFSLFSSFQYSTESTEEPVMSWAWTNSVAFVQCLMSIQGITEVSVDFLFEDGEFIFAAPNEQRLMRSTTGLDDFQPAGINNKSNDYSWMEMHGGFIFAGKENEAEVYFDTNSDLSALAGDPVDDADELVAGPGTTGTKSGISFLEKLAVSRDDGLWTMDTDDSDSSKWISKRTLNFRNLRDSTNFRSMATWGGSLYFSIQDKLLYQWNGAKLQDITPKRITVDWEYINYFRFNNLTPFGPWLLMSMRTSGTLTGDTGYRESIVAWDGVGFHAIAHPITDGDGSITMIAIDTVNNYIWYHVSKPSANTNITYYIQFQTDTDLPHANFPTTGTHRLTTSRIHAGFRRVDKSMPSLWVECDNMSTTQTIEVQYAIDDSSTFHSWETIKQNGETVLILPQNKYTEEFKYIRLRFIFVTDSSSQTPVLEAYAMMVMMRPDFKMGYSFDILGGTNAASGMFEDDRSGYSIMHDLRRLRNSKSPIELVTPFGDKVYGYLTSLTEIALEYEPEDDQGGNINILQLIRCNFVETLTISGTEQDVEPSW